MVAGKTSRCGFDKAPLSLAFLNKCALKVRSRMNGQTPITNNIKASEKTAANDSAVLHLGHVLLTGAGIYNTYALDNDAGGDGMSFGNSREIRNPTHADQTSLKKVCLETQITT